MGDAPPKHHNVIDMGGFPEPEVVDTGSGNIAPGVAAGHDPGQNVNPGHQLAAKEAVVTVDVLGQDNLNHFRFRIAYTLGL